MGVFMDIYFDDFDEQKQYIIERIAKARANANLSARALSQKIDMNEGYINRLESKRDFLPSVEVLLRIIKVCGMTLEEFFYSDSFSYKTDKDILNLLKSTDIETKQAILTILKRK